jgi:hypothetical protein
MRKSENTLFNIGYFLYRGVHPIIDPLKLLHSIPRYSKYVYDMAKYTSLNGAEPLKLFNLFPMIHENTKQTNFDPQYFYQNIWACNKIFSSHTKHHYDIGSSTYLIGLLTAFTKVTFVDIRPLKTKVKNLDSQSGDILHLPFKKNSIASFSCLHVAEHIGLGRYGDALDPYGTKKACSELSRVLSRGGRLYFSLPVGKPRLCFNAHRIHSPKQILEYFPDLKLIELSGVDDRGNFIEHIDSHILENSDYACGLFEFTKK